jgi:ribosome biogenesis GTPase
MEQAQGIVVSIIAGYYFVEAKKNLWRCRGRGKLRLDDLAPMAGDRVEFSPGPEGTGTVLAVLPRTNWLLRPAVANVGAVVVVLAPQNPPPNLLLADKLLAQTLSQEMEAVVCVNKADLDPQGAQALAARYRRAGFPSLACSALSGQGLDELVSMLGEGIAVLAGQSGAGKSQIIAQVAGGRLELPVEVGKLSEKIGRGKHTTRQVSLLPLKSGGKIADTPGFSVLDLDIDSTALYRFYPEFTGGACKFSPCYHVHEPECAVIAGWQQGDIDSSRYENYLKIYAELQEKEANRY